jgi:hypothetical protein
VNGIADILLANTGIVAGRLPAHHGRSEVDRRA